MNITTNATIRVTIIVPYLNSIRFLLLNHKSRFPQCARNRLFLYKILLSVRNSRYVGGTSLREKSKIVKNSLKQTDGLKQYLRDYFYSSPFYFNTVQHYSEVKNLDQKFIEF